MNKPLTIEQLKSFEVGDWVWIVTLEDYYRPNDVPYGEYHRIVGTCSHYYFEVNYGTTDFYELPYCNYGKTWLAYKNKEQAEGEYDSRVEEAKKQTAKEILQCWYNENKALGNEQDYVLELAEKYGVEVDE